jgi:hypothetical protein
VLPSQTLPQILEETVRKLESLASDKHASLFGLFVVTWKKTFYDIGTWVTCFGAELLNGAST